MQADRIAKKGNNIVTIGIKPHYPSTAYGYIQYDENNQMESEGAFQVKAFAEKPHSKLAERFIATVIFYGMRGCFWKVKLFLVV